MSKKKIEGDRYYTPRWIVDQCMQIVLPEVVGEQRTHRIIEPCAGTGRFVDGLRRKYPAATIIANDLFEDGRTWPAADIQTYVDYLGGRRWEADLLVTNPPFSLALEFIKRALTDTIAVVVLVRQGFLASAARAAFFREHPPAHVFLLANRPSFDVPPEVLADPAYGWKEGQTDTADYVFICWGHEEFGHTTRLHWLPDVPLKARQGFATLAVAEG